MKEAKPKTIKRQYRLVFDPKETKNNCIGCGQEIELEFSRCNVCEWDYICDCIEYQKQKNRGKL